MGDKILNYLKDKWVDLREKKGVFLSWFDEKEKLVFSKWILASDSSLKDNISKLMSEDKKIKYIVLDLVKSVVEISNPADIKNIDVKKEWIAIYSDKEDKLWVILPDTVWVADVKWAIAYILKKEKISSKKVIVYKFTTDRFVIWEK